MTHNNSMSTQHVHIGGIEVEPGAIAVCSDADRRNTQPGVGMLARVLRVATTRHQAQ